MEISVDQMYHIENNGHAMGFLKKFMMENAGAAAEIFSLAAELGVNTANFEVAHSVEGDRGILVLVIDRASQDVFKGGLIARGFRPSIQQLT